MQKKSPRVGPEALCNLLVNPPVRTRPGTSHVLHFLRQSTARSRGYNCLYKLKRSITPLLFFGGFEMVSRIVASVREYGGSRLGLLCATLKRRIGVARMMAAQRSAIAEYWLSRHRTRLLTLFAVLASVVSWVSEPPLQEWLVVHLDETQFAALHTMLLTLGGSMVGATAISFSVVMLAVQLNFAKIPHALFRKLSEDGRLLLLFFATFALATIICVLSVVPHTWTSRAILLAGWAVVLTLWCFLAAYKRALKLVSPSAQMGIILTDTAKTLLVWNKRSAWAKMAVETGNNDVGIDVARRAFFELNKGWDSQIVRAAKQFISFARAYAKQAEYDVSENAFNCLIQLNANYVQMRGRTFADTNPFFANAFSIEPLFNEVLEQLRMLAAQAVSTRDEQLVSQLMRALCSLSAVYSKIEYGRNGGRNLHHAQLAVGYLHGTVDDAMRIFDADLLMEATRIVSRSGQLILAAGQPLGIVNSVQKIAALSALGITKPNFAPVTSTAIRELATVELALIQAHYEFDADVPLSELRKALSLACQLVLAGSDAAKGSAVSGPLTDYYSPAGYFVEGLFKLANFVIQADANDEHAKRIAYGIAAWSDGVFRPTKDVLLTAVKSKSLIFLDVVMWIAEIVKMLGWLSKAPAASGFSKQFNKDATFLLCVVDWIPGDKETLTFVENGQLTEHLFRITYTALQQENDEIFEAGIECLYRWVLKGGRHHTGWAIFETGLISLSVLATARKDLTWQTWLEKKLAEDLASKAATLPEIRRRTEEEMRLYARGRRTTHSLSPVDHAAAEIDSTRLGNFLATLADLIKVADK